MLWLAGLALIAQSHSGILVDRGSDLDRLLELYESYGLPLPPKDAKPVVFETDLFVGDIRVLTLAFEYKSADGSNRYLAGTIEDWQPQQSKSGREARRTELRSTDPAVKSRFWAAWGYADERGWRFLDEDSLLATGIQAHALGLDDLARHLVQWGSHVDTGHPYGAFYVPQGCPDDQRVAYLALIDAVNGWNDPSLDRRRLGKKILTLYESATFLPQRSAQESLADFMSDLKKSIAPYKPYDDPAKRLIENLVLESGTTWQSSSPDPTPNETALMALGIEAIPALADHLNDTRMIGTVSVSFNNSPGGIVRVRGRVGRVLERLTDGKVCGTTGPFDRGVALGWYEWKQTGDILHYYRAMADPESTYPDHKTLEEFATAYPKEFVDQVDRMLRKKSKHLYSVVEVLVKVTGFESKKVALLKQLVPQNNDMRMAVHALNLLAVVSPKDARAAISDRLDQALNGTGKWTEEEWDPVSLLLKMVRVGDERLWQKLQARFERALPLERHLVLDSLRRNDDVKSSPLALSFLAKATADRSPSPSLEGDWGGTRIAERGFKDATIGDEALAVLYGALFTNRQGPAGWVSKSQLSEMNSKVDRELKRIGIRRTR